MHNFRTTKVTRNPSLDKNILRMNNKMGEELDLHEGEEVRLFVGRVFISMKTILSSHKSPTDFDVSPDVFRKLHLSTSRNYGICKDDEGIHIGPVVGIMADANGESSRLFGGQSLFISQLITEGRALGEICFAFSPGKINFSKKIINGYTYDKGVWKKETFPIPDVIYPRDRGYSATTLKIRKKFESLGCKLINPPLIGKWRTHQILSQIPSLSSYVPDTSPINSFRQVERMLRMHGSVYLKPDNGSMGRNIVRIVKGRSHNTYEYQYQLDSQPHLGTVHGINNLRQALRKVMGDRGYIVQRRINLIRVDNRIVDVRVMVQKDHTGEWSITGKGCRIGRAGSITSNISSGGSGNKVEKVLAHNFADLLQREEILREIDFLAIEAACALETYTSAMGELGIDIGIDTDGKIWFIEANLKPARKIFILIGDKVMRKLSVRKPLLYSRYLAGFSQER